MNRDFSAFTKIVGHATLLALKGFIFTSVQGMKIDHHSTDACLMEAELISDDHGGDGAFLRAKIECPLGFPK